ncbi:hypothetical protein AAW14_09125 [Streptomyces hygroscopicus]|nr:hypothetical protein [Streptomyces hygroscopicus]
MTAAGGPRRVWRWSVGVWAALVVTGGGLTLWLQHADQPTPRARWEQAPTPLLSADAGGTGCPIRAYTARPTQVICVHVRARARR